MEKPAGVAGARECSCQVQLERATRAPRGDAREVGAGDLHSGEELGWKEAFRSVPSDALPMGDRMGVRTSLRGILQERGWEQEGVETEWSEELEGCRESMGPPKV